MIIYIILLNPAKTYMKIFLPYIIVVTLTLIGACLGEP